MPKLCNINIDESKRLIDRIKSFAQQLKSTLPVHKVYLFGSFARAEIHEGSDIDLLIIGNFDERIFERIGKVLDLTDLPIQPLVYTEEEFDMLQESGSPLVEEILKSGIRIDQ